MRLKNVLALGVAGVIFTGTALGVSAANLKDIFDADYYASQYPDLKAAFGNDKEMLYQHFITYGLKEGRNMNPVLDVVAYREAYEDLDEAFGDDWDKYVDHFFAFGAKENREEGVMLNPIQYAAFYSDISEAFGNDLLSIAQHYETYGINENREEGTSRGHSSIASMKEAYSQSVASGTSDVTVPPTSSDTTVPPTSTETPDVTVPPISTETPDETVPPTSTETPDVTVPPTSTETPDETVPPTSTETPDEEPGGDSLYNAMIAMKEQYPEGMPWTNDNTYIWNAIPNTITTGAGCAAFAFILSDAAFGTEAPATMSEDVSTIRVGDVVRLNNDSHSVIILAIAENGTVTVAEGNFNNSIHWGREITKEELEANFNYLYTRY